MSQNRSSAVMQQRKVVPGGLDYFPTPPWATRALCRWLNTQGHDLSEMSCWEPACGEMHMVRPLREFFRSVRASDVYRYTDEHELIDFRFSGEFEPPVDLVISNPPFMAAEDFIRVACKVATLGFAMLVRTSFVEGQTRYDQLFSKNPPSAILQFVERVAMFEGRVIQTGKPDPFNIDEKTGEPRTASSATSYCWLVWLDVDGPDTTFHWLKPCRRELERDGDYPNYSEKLPPLEPTPLEELLNEAAA